MPCDYCTAGKEAPVITLFPAVLAARMARSSERKTDICEKCLITALETLRIITQAKTIEEWQSGMVGV